MISYRFEKDNRFVPRNTCSPTIIYYTIYIVGSYVYHFSRNLTIYQPLTIHDSRNYPANQLGILCTLPHMHIDIVCNILLFYFSHVNARYITCTYIQGSVLRCVFSIHSPQYVAILKNIHISLIKSLKSCTQHTVYCTMYRTCLKHARGEFLKPEQL